MTSLLEYVASALICTEKCTSESITRKPNDLYQRWHGKNHSSTMFPQTVQNDSQLQVTGVSPMLEPPQLDHHLNKTMLLSVTFSEFPRSQ